MGLCGAGERQEALISSGCAYSGPIPMFVEIVLRNILSD
jgi:hypothetical protein